MHTLKLAPLLMAMALLGMGCNDGKRGDTGEQHCDTERDGVYPGADELCDGVDNDCNGQIDDEAIDAVEYFVDFDEDGFGNPEDSILACTQPINHVTVGGDCDDFRSDVNLDATEYCDGVDNDCDGIIDENDAPDVQTWYADFDNDGFGDASVSTIACDAPSGYVSDDTDCDDSDPSSYPGATEHCDEVDNDCDGAIDEDISIWYADTDGDSYGDASDSMEACARPFGYVARSMDCDDTNAEVNPDATEVCNGFDDDCDGDVDIDDSSLDLSTATTYYDDFDGDGYGDPDDSMVECEQPRGHVLDDTDCDDFDSDVNPAATEVCDGVDNDCDGTSDGADAIGLRTWYADFDKDGYGDAYVSTVACSKPTGYVSDTSDCNDSFKHINPGGTELCEDPYFDEDCDGEPGCGDSDCSSYASCLETDCTDGVDDDGDGTIDCEDGDCALDTSCYESDCADSSDNDDDGLVDCDDDECWGQAGCPKVRISVLGGSMTERWERAQKWYKGWLSYDPGTSVRSTVYFNTLSDVRSSTLTGSATGVVSTIPSSLTWSTASSPTQCSWQVGGLSAHFTRNFTQYDRWYYSVAKSAEGLIHEPNSSVTRSSVYLAPGCEFDTALLLPAALYPKARGHWMRNNRSCLWYQAGATSTTHSSFVYSRSISYSGGFFVGTTSRRSGSASWTPATNSCDW